MLGMIYLFLAVMLGYEGSKILTEKNNHAGYAANRIWLILPASFGVGMLVLPGSSILFRGLQAWWEE